MKHFAFSLIVLAYLGFLGFINVIMFVPGNWMSAMGHFDFFYTGDTHNLIHELVFALVVGTAAVGLLSQLFMPKENFAGQLIALIAWVAMIFTAVIANNWVPQPLFIIFGGLTILATILHPAGLGLFNWVRGAKLNRVLLTLVIIAAVPLTIFAFTNIKLQIAGGGSTGFFHNPPAFHGGATRTTPVDMNDEAAHGNEHANEGHYRNLAAFSFIIILLGLLASFRPKDPLRHSSRFARESRRVSETSWRLAAWVAGLLPAVVGLASIVLPNAESSLGLFWGLAAIAWGVVFIAVAEVIRRKEFKEER